LGYNSELALMGREKLNSTLVILAILRCRGQSLR
jgi:hypothetical protein